MSIPFFISSDFITVVCDNRPHTIYSNESRFIKLRDAIKARAWDEIVNIVSLPKSIALFSKGKVQVFDGVVLFNNKEVHNTLTARILEFHRDGFPFEPLVCFMDKLMTNPNERSRDQLFNYLANYQLPITESGNFIAVKAVEKDTFLDKYTRTIKNVVGANIKMPRAECLDDDNVACAKSLHAGNYKYVTTYGNADDEAILVEINPKDIISCPKCSDHQKLRVCEYTVISHLGKVGKLEGFNSNYAPATEQGKSVYVEKPYIDPTVIEKSIDDGEGICNCKCGCQDEDDDEDYDNYAENSAQVEDNKIFQDVKVEFAKIDSKPANSIGQNPAYAAHKNGLTVYSSSLGQIDPNPSRTRAFFRQVKDWSF